MRSAEAGDKASMFAVACWYRDGFGGPVDLVQTFRWYLAMLNVGSGDGIHYRRFEAVSDIDVMVDGNLAVLRYPSLIDIAVRGQEAGLLECWHLDCYRRERDGGLWRVRWSQATSIDHP
ncbi:hypothetical protein [Micromonospora sp. NPDC050200]|uniref:hypothetical protein n=1 Tax=Micromonospora sp. NPDC050200 TaxID=3155664 RepID=UPI00340986CC